MILVVRGAASIEEIRALDDLGVDVVGTGLDLHSEGRVVDSSAMAAISTSLVRARLLVTPTEGAAFSAANLKQMGATWVEVNWRDLGANASWRRSLAAEGIAWVLGGVAADHDGDPGWVEANLDALGPPPPAWSLVEVAPGIEDRYAWSSVREPNEVDLDAADLDALAAARPIVFSIPFGLHLAPDVIAALPHALGFAFDLSPARADRTVGLEQLRTLVGAFRAG